MQRRGLEGPLWAPKLDCIPEFPYGILNSLRNVRSGSNAQVVDRPAVAADDRLVLHTQLGGAGSLFLSMRQSAVAALLRGALR